MRVSYKVGATQFTREVFASAPDQVIVIRLTADKPGRISLAASMSREMDATMLMVSGNRIVFAGEAIPHGDRQQDERKVGVKFHALLPALPKAWASGEIKGLRARGAFEIGLKWKAGKLESATLRSVRGQRCRLRVRMPVIVRAAGKAIKITNENDGTVSFPTTQGKIYTISGAQQ